ncbi:VWA domain-containing protein [bacterium]|nr:VWA domain-containing protein [bacterium]
MERIIIFFTILFFCGVVFAQNYTVYNKENYTAPKQKDEKTLFILDYSSSMDEYLEGETKYETMLKTMQRILPKIPKDKETGLRIYGHKGGFTAMNACRASSLVVPVMPASSKLIEQELYKYKPRGMTPITYSLKQAVTHDLSGLEKEKRIILLTDGGENCDESPCEWAMNLISKRKDIKIDVIAFNVDERDDLDQLRCTSSVTSGRFYNPQTSAELIKSLENSLNITKDVEGVIVPKH